MSLATLPTELKLKVLENTHAKDVVRVRRVCKALRDVVDEYRSTLANTIHARRIQDFKAFLDYHQFDDMSLFESLTRFLAHKGKIK